jgi:hypothetical protein
MAIGRFGSTSPDVSSAVGCFEASGREEFVVAEFFVAEFVRILFLKGILTNSATDEKDDCCCSPEYVLAWLDGQELLP